MYKGGDSRFLPQNAKLFSWTRETSCCIFLCGEWTSTIDVWKWKRLCETKTVAFCWIGVQLTVEQSIYRIFVIIRHKSGNSITASPPIPSLRSQQNNKQRDHVAPWTSRPRSPRQWCWWFNHPSQYYLFLDQQHDPNTNQSQQQQSKSSK